MAQEEPQVITEPGAKQEEAPKTPVEEKKVEEETPKTEETPKVEEVTLSKAEHEALVKSSEAGENYKKENEKYRKKRVDEIQPATPQPEPEQPVQPESTIPYETEQAVRHAYLKDKKEILDSLIIPFSETATQEQWNKFSSMASVSLEGALAKALNKGEFTSRHEMEKHIKELISYSKGPDNQKIEQARAEGAAEAAKLEQADIGAMRSTKKTDSSGVSEEAKAYSERSGGAVTPERAQEISDAKAKRALEFTPQVRADQID